MIDNVTENLDSVDLEQLLIRQHRQIINQIHSLEMEDPLLVFATEFEAEESGTVSWQTAVHDDKVALKNNLRGLKFNIEKALQKIRGGSYGICEKCHRQIDAARLRVMPTARCCVDCV